MCYENGEYRDIIRELLFEYHTTWIELLLHTIIRIKSLLENALEFDHSLIAKLVDQFYPSRRASTCLSQP